MEKEKAIKIIRMDHYFVYYQEGWKMALIDYARLKWKPDKFIIGKDENSKTFTLILISY